MAKRKPVSREEHTFSLSPHMMILSEIGPATAKATQALAKDLDGARFVNLKELLKGLFPMMAEAMKIGWSDSESAAVICAVRDRLRSEAWLDIAALQRWIQVHPGDSSSVIDCISADPPEGVNILKVLSRAGSQKLVFLASWQIAQKQVVLKRFRGSNGRILQRETQTHPLSMAHPNIIETHLLQNKKGEHFLLERRLPLVLNDEWRSNGVQEAANLLRDISSALAFLLEQGLVHGDIKPDNIGFENGRYILLDFGICRPQAAFQSDATPTGSLRTRAPELIMGQEKHSDLSDIWALGATVFNALLGRFPLFDANETPPRVSEPSKRDEFEELLRNRVQEEWDRRIDLSLIHAPLRSLLGSMLELNPQSRIKAQQLLQKAEAELSAVLRFREGATCISASQEIEQLTRFLPDTSILALLPEAQRQSLRSKIDELHASKGLPPDRLSELNAIESRLP